MKIKNMKKIISAIIIVFCTTSNAQINNNYQMNKNYQDVTVIPVSNDYIILNATFDDFNSDDPRIKSILTMCRKNNNGVSVVFFNLEHLRFVSKLNHAFENQGITTTKPMLIKATNSNERNQVRIYITH